MFDKSAKHTSNGEKNPEINETKEPPKKLEEDQVNRDDWVSRLVDQLVDNAFNRSLAEENDYQEARYSLVKKLLSPNSTLDKCDKNESTQVRLPLFRSYNEPISLMDSKCSVSEQVFVWFALEHNLTESQRKLDKKLLNALEPLAIDSCSFDNTERLEEFLQDNKDNPDLKAILNVKRGESGSTVLHFIAGADVSRFRLPGNRAIDLLLAAGADPEIRNDEGETPFDRAVAMSNLQNVRSFLERNANPNTRDRQRKTPQQIANESANPEVRNLFLETVAKELDYNRKECLPKSEALWSNLMPAQQKKLSEFSDMVSQAQNMSQLGEVVNAAIKSGVRLNYCQSFLPQYPVKWYSFTDYVIKKISELEKNPKVASDIICQLVSKGAVFGSEVSIRVIDELELEFRDHKANMIKACEDYINNAHRFIKVAKSATNGKLKDVKVGNAIFCLGYSEDSEVDVAKITDEARSSGLTRGSTEYGRHIVKIGKSEVEIITQEGIRNYTNLGGSSDIVLTFHTGLGELEVRLYSHKQNKDLIRVEVIDQEKWEKLKNCNEEIGKNCLLGGYSVYNAVEQGYFRKSEKLINSEVISQSNEQAKLGYWAGREEIRRASDSGRETGRVV